MSLMSSVFSLFFFIFLVLFTFVFLLLVLLFFILVVLILYFLTSCGLFFHRDEFYDSYLDSARKDALDVERFKLMYGAGRVKEIQTVKDAHQAIKWSNSCSVAFENPW